MRKDEDDEGIHILDDTTSPTGRDLEHDLEDQLRKPDDDVSASEAWKALFSIVGVILVIMLVVTLVVLWARVLF